MRGGLLVSLLVGLLGIGPTLSYTQLIAWYVISCWVLWFSWVCPLLCYDVCSLSVEGSVLLEANGCFCCRYKFNDSTGSNTVTVRRQFLFTASYSPLDEAIDWVCRVQDWSGNGHHASLINSPKFDGISLELTLTSSQYVELPVSFATAFRTTDRWSFAGWVNFKTVRPQ
jgi:hypothetical protein